MKLCPNVQINPYNVYTEDLKKKTMCAHNGYKYYMSHTFVNYITCSMFVVFSPRLLYLFFIEETY